MALNDTQKTTREGVAYATVLDAFPKLQKQHPHEFTSDVQTLYEFMLQPPKQGPGLLQLHGNPHQQFTQWEAWIRSHKPLRKALAKGDYTQASHLLNFQYKGGPQLPAPLFNGQLDPRQAEAQAVQHVAHHGSIADRIGAGASSAGSAIGTGAGDVGSALGGVGSWFKNNLMLVVLLVVVVLIVKK